MQATQVSDNGSTHGSVTPFIAMPLFPVASTILPGTAALTVPKKKTMTVTLGSYEAVRVEQKGVLKLTPGVYQVASVDIEPHARLEAMGPVELRTSGKLATGTHIYLGPAPGTSLGARDLRIEVAGSDTQTPAALFGNHAELRAIIIARHGTIRLGSHNTAVGAFFGDHVDIEQHAKVSFEDGFPCAVSSCDDGNPCTVDSCVAGACVHTPLAEGALCSDGDECNGIEICDSEAICQPGMPLEVDDGNPCTADLCDPTEGVFHLTAADGTSCDDEDACTQSSDMRIDMLSHADGTLQGTGGGVFSPSGGVCEIRWDGASVSDTCLPTWMGRRIGRRGCT